MLRRRESPEKVAWLNVLQAKGKVPGLRVLETIDGDEADNRELWWINEWKAQGAGLVNQQLVYPKGKAVRWNLWLPTLLQEEISRIATERGISASQLVKEWLWEKLQPHLWRGTVG